MESAFHSSRFALAFAMGVGAYIGVLHLWLWSRRDGGAPHSWVALFCLGSLGFQTAHYVQLNTEIPETALICARFQVAMVSVLVVSVVGFARSLAQRRFSAWLFGGFALANAALGVVTLRTALFVPKIDGMRADWFGDFYLAAPAAPAMALLLPYIFAVFLYVAHELVHSDELAREESRALLLSLGVYSALGALSVLSALRAVSFPVLTQYGPLVVALGLSYMLLHRHQRQRLALEHTAEVQAQALGETQARYRSLVDSAPAGIAACRSDGSLVAINRRMFDILGAPPSATLSDTGRINVLPADYPDAANVLGDSIAELLLQCVASGESTTEELACTSRWGAELRLSLNVASLHDRKGEITGAQAIVEDISARMRLEDQLRHWQKMEAVGQLAAGIAHEINNPMAYVRTNLRLLKEEWSDLVAMGANDSSRGSPELKARADECEELIDESLQGVDRTIAIVRDVKEFAHSGEARIVPLDLVEVLESSIRMATAQLPSGIAIERSYVEIPPVRASGGQLRQVFLNLLVNAIQALDGSGSILVSVREESDQIVVGVKDDGCGIPSDALEHLFEPFYTTKAAGEGTGLGLYISYEIIRAQGGDIRVQSVPGEGTLFEVCLAK